MEKLKYLKTFKIDRNLINERSFGIKDKKIIDELIDCTTDSNGFIQEVMKFLSDFNSIPIQYLENRFLCETAHSLYSQKDKNPEFLDNAQRYFLKAASQGSAEGLFFLASLKYMGDGCEVNLPMSLQLFKRGADLEVQIKCQDGFLIENKNVIDCCKCAAGFFYEGIGDSKNQPNYESSFKYYKKTIENRPNDLDAIHYLGKLEILLNKNIEKAIEYFKKGMKLGSADCIFALGENTFDSNPEEAFKLIKRASNEGCEEAEYRLGEFKDKLKDFNKSKK